jgi:membrane fusion protein, multidrug efflux system
MAETKQRGRQRWVLAAVAIALAAGAFVLWRYLSPRESTDDAQVSGHVSPLAARIGGTVKSVHVADNQIVKAGDVLIELDPRDYQIALDRARADLAAAEAAARGAKAAVPITATTTASELSAAQAGASNAEAGLRVLDRETDASEAKLAAATAKLDEVTANATRAAQDVDRFRPLAAKDEISKQQMDAAVAGDQAGRAAVSSAQAAVREAQANIETLKARRTVAQGTQQQAQAQARSAGTAPQQVSLTQAKAQGAEAQVLQARAAVDQAALNLERTTVRAPVGGIVSRKTVEVGQVIQPGQALLALTSTADVWVTANFKETQLQQMRTGQRVEVDVDAYGGHAFRGHIDSIAAATGATFSLLPPENASGNFVKVVQRVPVKIVLDDAGAAAGQLRPGMSANATVYLK